VSVYVAPIYAYSQQFNGVVAANTYFSITNPSNSGKIVLTLVFIATSTSVGAVSGAAPIIMYRASSVSGGTLQDNATEVAKFNTATPDSIIQLRTNNPTATLGTRILAVQSTESTGTGSSAAATFQVPSGGPGAILLPGESIAIRTANGDLDQRWNLNLLWQERDI
jgi:hypothetical protein